jgi:hypothetical protein
VQKVVQDEKIIKKIKKLGERVTEKKNFITYELSCCMERLKKLKQD